MPILCPLRQRLDNAIGVGDLTTVASIVGAAKAAPVGSANHFKAVFSPERADHRHVLPLHAAIYAGQGAIVTYLLDEGVGLESRDDAGATALFRAFGTGRIDLAGQLIAAGADIFATSDIGTRVFDMVLSSGSEHYLHWFLCKGLSLEHQNAKGSTALHFACHSSNVAMVFQVQEVCGIGFDYPNVEGRRPIDWCTDYGVFTAILERYPHIAPNIAFANRGSSLLDFAERGNGEIVRYLLDAASEATARVCGALEAAPAPVEVMEKTD